MVVPTTLLVEVPGLARDPYILVEVL